MEFGKYGHCAIMAFELVKNEGIPAREAWQIAAEKIFEGKPSSIAKGYPKNAFLSLMGQNNRRSKNGTYAMEALDIIDKLGKDDIDNISPNKFWRDYMGKEISHNHQIDVVFALRSKGYV